MLKFQPKQDIREAVDRAVAMLNSMAKGDDIRSLRGSTIEHKRLARVFGVTYQTPNYYALAQKLGARLLKEHGISMEAVTTVGYQLNTPKGQLGKARSRILQGARRYRTAKSIAAALPMEECTDMTDMRVKTFIEDVASEQERKARELSRQAAFLSHPTTTREPLRIDDDDQPSPVPA